MLALLGSAGKAQKPAAGALAKLACRNREIQDVVTELGGVPLLLSLLNISVPEVQVQAAAALAELAHDNVNAQTVVRKAGGIGPLLALLGSR